MGPLLRPSNPGRSLPLPFSPLPLCFPTPPGAFTPIFRAFLICARALRLSWRFFWRAWMPSASSRPRSFQAARFRFFSRRSFRSAFFSSFGSSRTFSPCARRRARSTAWPRSASTPAAVPRRPSSRARWRSASRRASCLLAFRFRGPSTRSWAPLKSTCPKSSFTPGLPPPPARLGPALACSLALARALAWKSRALRSDEGCPPPRRSRSAAICRWSRARRSPPPPGAAAGEAPGGPPPPCCAAASTRPSRSIRALGVAGRSRGGASASSPGGGVPGSGSAAPAAPSPPAPGARLRRFAALCAWRARCFSSARSLFVCAYGLAGAGRAPDPGSA